MLDVYVDIRCRHIRRHRHGCKHSHRHRH